jgi:hypothetical protein
METIQVKLPDFKDLKYEVIACEDNLTPVRGNAMVSGDEAYDKRVEESILRRLRKGNYWAWASVEVRATWKGVTASDYLGGCCYKNEADFKKCGYYDDMCKTVYNEIIAQLKAMAI